MNIKLKPKKKKDGAAFYFASLPESIQGNMDASMQSFDVISKGNVKVPQGTGAKEIKWSGEFFGKSKKNEPIIKSEKWKSPKKSVQQLKKWMNHGVVLNLVISGTWINMDVTISELHVEEYGAYGNVKYTITLTQYRKLKIHTTKELKTAAYVYVLKERDNNSQDNYIVSSQKKYEIKSGDTLWMIAANHCKGGTNWTKLYNANASAIEAAAKRHGKTSSDHGHWIYPGEIIVLL